MKTSEQSPTSRRCNTIVLAARTMGTTFGCEIQTLGSKKSYFSLFYSIRFRQFRKVDIQSDRKTPKNVRFIGILTQAKNDWFADNYLPFIVLLCRVHEHHE